jgi:hypothetical protein
MLSKRQIAHQEKYLAGVDEFVKLGNHHIDFIETEAYCFVPHCLDPARLVKYSDDDCKNTCSAILCQLHYKMLDENVQKGLQCKGKKRKVDLLE